ncbi:MAG: cytochrome c [Cytophagaceae bacterium]|nr:cytochrome c [Cytophagaceae bacterium]MDW8455619.1 cytochrome c [Cytophagaceae bacterium]
MKWILYISATLFIASIFSACNHNFDHIPVHENTRWEFSPQMYHSEAYEPVTQVVDRENYPESYNTSPGNNGMNVRMPVPNTIKRGFTPYNVDKDSLNWAAANLKSPFTVTEELLAEGEVLYKRYCSHCHGDQGKADGKVAEKFKGIADLTQDRLKAASEGHFFHVISKGKGRMLSHASQISQEERWKIAHYVKEKLQKTE